MQNQYDRNRSTSDVMNDYTRRQIENADRRQVNFFEAGAAGLLAAALGKVLFGNRGS